MRLKIFMLGLSLFFGLQTIMAQDNVLEEFVLNDFFDGKVHLKDGRGTTGKFNYNFVDEQMCILDNEDNILLLAVASSRIDYIDIKGHIFVPGERRSFFERITLDSGEYYIRWTGKRKHHGGDIGYGIESATINENKKYKAISADRYAQSNSQEFGGVEKTNIPNFYLKNDNGKFIRIKSVKDFVKLYPDKKKEIEEYAKENKLKLKNKDDFEKLFTYCVNLAKD
ncbi:hypothetical protein [Dysgonomonas massiliensis]|uniref:hypothetical protein n=1 Tax=Dysgonomonas massiliensis TaxID=2040292 RepID=UPI000C7858C8|nr:hypothetical protein [Dysgonomonas massiliensis]